MGTLRREAVPEAGAKNEAQAKQSHGTKQTTQVVMACSASPMEPRFGSEQSPARTFNMPKKSASI